MIFVQTIAPMNIPYEKNMIQNHPRPYKAANN